jgi:adenylate cyclase
MGTEIERKFLVSPLDAVKALGLAGSGTLIEQGYLSFEPEVRVRIAGSQGFVTVKGPRSGASRSEYEFEVPLEDAKELLTTLCKSKLEKTRRYLSLPDGHLIELDQYGGRLSGLFIAEVELAQEGDPIALPEWIGREVTLDPRYSNKALAMTQALPPAEPPQDEEAFGQALKQVLEGILQATSKGSESPAAAPSETIRLATQAAIALDPFRLNLLLMREAKQARKELLFKQYPSNWDLLFLFEQEDFFRRHYRSLFEAYEGSCCCADKAGVVLQRIAKFYGNRSPIKFDYNSPHAYAYPTKILTTQEDILDMQEGLAALYNGRPDKYLRQLERLSLAAKSQGGLSAPASP